MTPTPQCRWCQRRLVTVRGFVSCGHCDATVCRTMRPCLTCTELMRVVPDPDFTNRAEGS